MDIVTKQYILGVILAIAIMLTILVARKYK